MPGRPLLTRDRRRFHIGQDRFGDAHVLAVQGELDVATTPALAAVDERLRAADGAL